MQHSKGYLYAIKAEGTPYVKVGHTTKTVENRLRYLQSAHPLPLTILASVRLEHLLPETEHQIHRLLASQRRQGEWFEMTLDGETFLQLVEEAQHVLAFQASRPHKRQTIEGLATLGQNIVKARIDKRMKQQDLLHKVGLSQRYLSAVENDKVDPRISVVRRIARALGVSVDALLVDVAEHEEADYAA